MAHRFEEFVDMFPQPPDFVVAQESGIEATAWNTAALRTFGGQPPSAVEIPNIFVALIQQPLMDRGQQLQGVAQRNDELRVGPDPENSLHPLRGIKVGD